MMRTFYLLLFSLDVYVLLSVTHHTLSLVYTVQYFHFFKTEEDGCRSYYCSEKGGDKSN